MKDIKLNYKKIAEQIKSIHLIAREKKWIPYYDKELDSFYFTPNTIDSKYFLQAIGEELLVYVDEDSNIGGIFAEYFGNNLASHDEKFKPFKKIIVQKQKLTQEIKILLLSTFEASLLEAITPKFSLRQSDQKDNIKISSDYL